MENLLFLGVPILKHIRVIVSGQKSLCTGMDQSVCLFSLPYPKTRREEVA